MAAFTVFTARAVSLPEDDVDTDIIFPARFLTITEKRGLGRYAFYDRRHDGEGQVRADAPDLAGAGILIAGANFGCGSSREQAPWALADLGIRCLIAPGFGEIFAGNCFRNGILPIVLDGAPLARVRGDAGAELTIDLVARRIVRPDGEAIAFAIEDWRREPLLNGWDEIATILGLRAADIDAFEQRQRAAQPWLWRSARPQESLPHG
jgi:3-isopropylmalate dehydratase small subunit